MTAPVKSRVKYASPIANTTMPQVVGREVPEPLGLIGNRSYWTSTVIRTGRRAAVFAQVPVQRLHAQHTNFAVLCASFSSTSHRIAGRDSDQGRAAGYAAARRALVA
ncbi:hypothetical protein QCN29_00560 [Streptomyces sp. HNM0663]|uniref:Uncharacterized protein n=1 Tax=Streptomyces chengmaiensis TaxID=3040919 RepID=A0ABT6HG48_9ACTN|nr:hypothetical protein [Streptomyces chengmaiensis]MDH2387301.1 hypothetical protein [Streptomyces chengmaiensis]